MHQSSLFCLPFLFTLAFLFGCGNQQDVPRNQSAKNKPAVNADDDIAPQVAVKNASLAAEIQKTETISTEKPKSSKQEKTPVKQPNYAALGELLKQPVDSMSRMAPEYPRIQVDEEKADAEGIRKLAGKRLTLYTDMQGEEIDILPTVFDLAFPQYCEYFGIDPETLGDWHTTGFLMKDKERFVKAGLFPSALPDFPHGFSWNYDFWLYDQKSDYYRRHLLIHEGAHCFMNTVLGGCGAPWYMEGMAEMLGTHAWREGKLTLNYFPKNREEVPELGRIRIIHDDLSAHRALTLAKILENPSSVFHSNDGYAWSWAAAKFLDSHPRYQKRFRELSKYVLDADFNGKFHTIFAQDFAEMCEEWQVLAAGLEYGYDVPRTAIDFTPGKAMENKAEINVAADRGWQNSGIRLEGGERYELAATGRWTKKCRSTFWTGLKNVPEKIELEPSGVSIRYYHDLPLGVLLAVVRPDVANPAEPSVFLHPTTVGLKTILVPKTSGTLYFKLNDTAADLESNSGEVKVEISRSE